MPKVKNQIILGGGGGDRGSVVPVPPCVVPGTMVVKPFGTICEEVIGAERREKFFRWYQIL